MKKARGLLALWTSGQVISGNRKSCGQQAWLEFAQTRTSAFGVTLTPSTRPYQWALGPRSLGLVSALYSLF